MARGVSATSWIDYYAVLGVRPDATSSEIRTSFKRLIVQCHPDKNPRRREWSERRVRELIEAYDILGNPRNRQEFDRQRAYSASCIGAAGAHADGDAGFDGERGDGWGGRPTEPYFFRRNDPGSRALVVLYLLLRERSDDAVRVLAEMEGRLGKGFLRDHLDRDDYLDCLFLVAEFHLGRRQYAEATERLRAFYDHEVGSRFPRHYMDQVVDLLKDLYLRKLPRWASAEVALEGLRGASLLQLTRAEESLRVRRLVEALLATGAVDEARRVLHLAGDALGGLEELRRLVEAAGRRRGKGVGG